jgi:hypothetical protein
MTLHRAQGISEFCEIMLTEKHKLRVITSQKREFLNKEVVGMLRNISGEPNSENWPSGQLFEYSRWPKILHFNGEIYVRDLFLNNCLGEQTQNSLRLGSPWLLHLMSRWTSSSTSHRIRRRRRWLSKATLGSLRKGIFREFSEL